ncbi:hypothetical protein K440DRAFT_610837 [Wilcoxina mikolae CBS 423.85]|nr:hypothetical protein K440DRAFT_610837 [Wilcoxina mikolae CBS 423.85]
MTILLFPLTVLTSYWLSFADPAIRISFREAGQFVGGVCGGGPAGWDKLKESSGKLMSENDAGDWVQDQARNAKA